jgi:HD-GYP domain-containing protein (c-di-GMP phosphodiesterase class II)
MLEGDDTPLASRILAVADSYWALRAERPYRPAFGADAALATVVANAGEQYDAGVVEMLRPALEACEQVPASA